jgi:capsid protein
MGAGKPSIDPLKEVNAVKIRQELGHTTGEREAIQYNNSDFSENARRLKIERELLGTPAADPMQDPAQPVDPNDNQNPDDQEDGQ